MVSFLSRFLVVSKKFSLKVSMQLDVLTIPTDTCTLSGPDEEAYRTRLNSDHYMCGSILQQQNTSTGVPIPFNNNDHYIWCLNNSEVFAIEGLIPTPVHLLFPQYTISHNAPAIQFSLIRNQSPPWSFY